jgi:hypothetical protein
MRPGVAQIYGVAFSGGSPVTGVDVSLDGGRTWHKAHFFGPDLGRYAWRQFALQARFEPGSYVLSSRAAGAEVQPELRVENERGYAHNGWRDHSVKVTVA